MDAQAKSLAQGAELLQKKILEKIKDLDLSGISTAKPEILDGIRQNLDAGVFNKHNQTGIVEVRATFKAIRDSELLWELEIIWDADNPVPSDKSNAQTAHYGYEVYKNNIRVAGPGHIFFEKNIILPHYRIKNIGLIEDLSLKLSKSGKMGNGTMTSETRYFKLKKL
ncbi:hypothetical protein B7463_g11269, partial [Scytalidium lignicola]